MQEQLPRGQGEENQMLKLFHARSLVRMIVLFSVAAKIELEALSCRLVLFWVHIVICGCFCQ